MSTGLVVVEDPLPTIERESPGLVAFVPVGSSLPGPLEAAPSYRAVPVPVNDSLVVLSTPVIVSAGRNSPGIAGLGASATVIVMESPPQGVELGQPLKFRLPVYVPAHVEVGAGVEVLPPPPPPQAAIAKIPRVNSHIAGLVGLRCELRSSIAPPEETAKLWTSTW